MTLTHFTFIGSRLALRLLGRSLWAHGLSYSETAPQVAEALDQAQASLGEVELAIARAEAAVGFVLRRAEQRDLDGTALTPAITHATAPAITPIVAHNGAALRACS